LPRPGWAGSFAAAGMDPVTDVHVSEGDRVQLDPGMTYTLSQQGADTVIDMGGGSQMLLAGVQLSSLPSGWSFEALPRNASEKPPI
jgi:hypothetical protein